MSTDWGIMVGFALGAMWAWGILVLYLVFRTKPHSMKEEREKQVPEQMTGRYCWAPDQYR